ncbi:MAG: hypothetical protein HOL37_09390 [Rhodospirillaceae bacterium]|nr:hypothetical protein [Rhodospirillaceae bacterium]MBT5309535.1 hypothetical protein [Rhodospirillaceae bacterium]MBT7356349.1 hypothetical protein [Rhodospirillaceae bacterium]
MLRRWVLGHAFGRIPGAPDFTPHVPPYLEDLLPLAPERPTRTLGALQAKQLTGPVMLNLAGLDVTVVADDLAALFVRNFDDLETQLSLHRFAWVRDDSDPDQVDALWRAWAEGFSTPLAHWSWHPYTAGERAVNILNYASQHGLPGDRDRTIAILAAHAPAIAARLEYFGDHHTSNHLANNGRALYVLGRRLGMAKAESMGLKILQEEADRLFSPSGMLREGSSHYHLLVLRLYEDLVHEAFAETVTRARRVASALMLPGGLPLVGDISPDISPDDLLAVLDLQGDGVLDGDGWLRADVGAWSGLWHASPEGFSHMPGHGHQDVGSFDLHYGDEAVIVDPGRGAYGEDGDAALYRSAVMHNGLMLGGKDPYPANKPYYDDDFRERVAGSAPSLQKTTAGVRLNFDAVERDWDFDGDTLTLTDHVRGSGAMTITRTLITPLPVEQKDGGVMIQGRNARYWVECGDGDIHVRLVTRWLAYGRGIPATAITITRHGRVPFDGEITLSAMA